jgi:uncharacterized membrane protein
MRFGKAQYWLGSTFVFVFLTTLTIITLHVASRVKMRKHCLLSHGATLASFNVYVQGITKEKWKNK